MQKLYLLLMLTLSASVSLRAQRVSEGFATSLTPQGWTLSNSSGLLLREPTVNGYQTTVDPGCVLSDNYNVSFGTSTLETYSFSPTAAGDSLRFDVAAAVYNDPPDLYSDSLLIYAYDGTNYTLLRAWETKLNPDTGITTATGIDQEFVPTSSEWRTKVIALPVGTTRIRFDFVTGWGNQVYVDNVVVDSFYIASMAYNSSTTTQTITSGVIKGSKNQRIIGIQVNMTGNISPLSVTDFFLNAGSSTSLSADVDSAKIFCTGTLPVFDTLVRFGAIPTPAGYFSISGNYQLQQGNNYFWLVYDVNSAATTNNTIDAACDQIVIGGSAYAPTVSSPAGDRKILAPFSGSYTIGTNGTYAKLSDALAELNVVGMSGNTRFEIISNITESAAIIINKWTETGAGGYRLTISPTVADTIFADALNSGAIVLLGASRVTIDGRIAGSGNNLTIVNTNQAADHAGILVVSTGTGQGSENDTICNVNIMTGSNSVNTIGLQAQGDNNNNLHILNNVFKRAQNGINIFTTNYPAGANTGLQVTGNTIGDISNADNVNRIGVNIANSPAAVISGNSIYNLNDLLSERTVGIQVGSNCSNSMITGNKIDSVLNDNSGGWGAYGINITGSDTLTIANNVITRVAIMNYSSSSTTYNPFGIRITSGSGHKVVYNSVNIYGNSLSSGSAGTLSAAFLVTGGSNLVVRNNIFANSYEGLTGSASYAAYVTPTSPFAVINNNNYYFSGTYGNLGYKTSARNTIAAWRTATTQDANSISSNPYFTANSDLTINSGANGTEMESGGVAIAGITTDFNGDPRPKTVPTTYGGNTAPDMGAFEFDGQPADLTAPTITYTPLTNTLVTATRTLTGFATATDASGINTTIGNKPRIYYKKSSDANAFGFYPADNNAFYNGWKYAEAANSASPFDFVIDHSLIYGGSIVATDTIQYFVVAQDLAVTPNTGASPAAGFAATDVNTITSAPATPSYYIITAGPLSGTYQVGASQTAPNYATLTNALNDLNLRGVGAAVTFELTDVSYSASETFPLNINAVAGVSATNTITIKPAAGVTPVISGSSGTAVLKVTATDYLVIDGSNNGTASRDLTITNTNVAGSTVLWIGNAASPTDAATHVTVKNIIVTGNTPSTTIAGFLLGSGATLGSAAEISNNNITIQNNLVTRAQNGVFAIGNATTLDSNWLISGNTFGSATPADKLGYRGVAVQNAKNFSVEGNTIAGVTISGTNSATGILAGAGLNTGSISKNKITGITNTNSGGYGALGVYINTSSTNANLTIANNFISEVTGEGYSGGWAPEDNGYGIMINNGGNIKVYFNTVSLATNQTNGGNTAPINIAFTASNLDIRNNLFINAQTTGTRYAIYSDGANTALTSINYNNYASSGSIGYLGSGQTTLADWKTATGQDAASVNVPVTVVSASDLHLSGASIGDLNLKCPPIAGITTDIDNDVRNTVTPWQYMGADENTSAPLPVELSRFTAVKVKHSARLEWVTATEINNEKFIVERSADGRNFTGIGTVKGAGNSSRTQKYQFTDEQAAAFAGASGKVFYRLTQIDFNGQSSRSDVAVVYFGNERTNALTAYPNPVLNTVTLTVQSENKGQMNILVTDIQGREVYSTTWTVENGTNSMSVDMRSLNAGLYFVKATLNGNASYYKIYKK